MLCAVSVVNDTRGEFLVEIFCGNLRFSDDDWFIRFNFHKFLSDSEIEFIELMSNCFSKLE